MDYTQILLRPVITEKATTLREQSGQIAFYVAPGANKIEIHKAVEAAFNVKVENVNVITVKSRPRKRQGRVKGRIPGYRKAYVTLAPGEKIELFEGV